MSQVVDFFRNLFSTSDWPPRWQCGTWTPFQGWLYIVSDLMVWLAYFLMPLIILNYLSKKKAGVKFHKIYFLFAAFILLCGSTHFLDVVMFWVPMYRLNALVRFATGVVSLLTVYQMVNILPEVFKQRTNLELENEIARRQLAEEQLAEANKGLEAFVYIASHDLKEPLRKVKTFTTLLQQENAGVFDTKSKGYVDKIISASGRMQLLINDVLTLSSLNDATELSVVNINDTINKALEDLEVLIEEKGAIIKVDAPQMVIGNEMYLSQLFLNLVSNAIKFSDKQPTITITGEVKEGTAFIYVADNGIGIEKKDFKRIFQAFERVNSKSQFEGSGIGLAICKRIIDIHKGSIQVASQPGIGTTFTIQLPAA